GAVGIPSTVPALDGTGAARRQQGAAALVIAPAVLLRLPLDRQHPLPAVGAQAVPFRADGEQAAETVGVGQLLVLIAAGQTQVVGQRLVARHVVPEADVLPGGGPLGVDAVAMSLGVAPVAGALEGPPRAPRRGGGPA